MTVSSSKPTHTTGPECSGCAFVAYGVEFTTTDKPTVSAVTDLVSCVRNSAYIGLCQLILYSDPSTVYAVFTAYAITSTELLGGSCITQTDPTTTVEAGYSVARPSVSYNEPQFRQSAQSQIMQDVLEGSGCEVLVPTALTPELVSVLELTPTVDQLTPSTIPVGSPIEVTTHVGRFSTEAQSTTPPSATTIVRVSISQVNNFTSTTQSSTLSFLPVASNSSSSLTPEAALPSHSISPVSSPKTKIIVGTIIPTTFIVLSFLGIVLWRRYRFRRSVPASLKGNSDGNDLPPFLQQKAELHGDPCMHEMEDEHRRQEAQAEEIRHQMMDDGTRPELEGDHYRHELEAPSGQ